MPDVVAAPPCAGIVRLDEDCDWGYRLVGNEVDICGMNGRTISHLFRIDLTTRQLVRYANVDANYIGVTYTGRYAQERTHLSATAQRRVPTAPFDATLLKLCRMRDQRPIRAGVSGDIFLVYGDHKLLSVNAYGFTRYAMTHPAFCTSQCQHCRPFARDRNNRILLTNEPIGDSSE